MTGLVRPGTARWSGLAEVLAAPRYRRPAMLAAALLAGGLALALSGPMAGGLAAGYAAAGTTAAYRRRQAGVDTRSQVAAVDVVSTLSAELRAGLPATTALAAVRERLDGLVGDGARAVVARLSSAVMLAEASGAPLADVLDRLDGHLRAMERARRTAQAQAAGARASAALLAVMPVAGVGLGLLVGVDPAHVLLHTPLGAACLGVATVLQLAGLAWAGRLSRVEVPA